MKVYVTSVFVEDQDEALAFYTGTLGFTKKADVPVGAFRWLTVVSPEDPDGTEVLLEPNEHPAAKTYQRAIFADGIPATSFETADIEAECARLRERGVRFTLEPTQMGEISVAVFDDTCGNLVQLVQLVQR